MVEVEPRAKQGEPSILNLESEILDTTKDNCSLIVGVLDMNLVEGLVSAMEQETGIGLTESLALVIEKQLGVTGSTTLVVNTNCRIYSKSLKEGGFRE